MPVGEDVLARLLHVAVIDADPDEVTPALDASGSWTARRRAWLLDYHRARRPGLAGPCAEATWAVLHGAEVVGAVRLHATGAPGTVELGIWLGRSSRGQGVGPRAVARAVETARAAGATVLLARTTTGNRAARALLASLGAHETVAGDDVTARIPLRPGPQR